MKAKYTPEERRAVRINQGKRLVKWRKEHTLTTIQRQAIGRKTHDWWVSMSEGDRQKLSDKLRIKTIRQMSSKTNRIKAAEYAKQGWKKTGYSPRFEMTDDIKDKIAFSNKGKSHKWDKEKFEEWKRKQTRVGQMKFANQGKKNHPFFKPGVRERALANSAEEGKTNPLRGRFETNIHAKDWHLRDPEGNLYHFNNLNYFVRHHKSLFSQYQLEEIRISKKNCWTPRVTVNLGMLRPTRINPVKSSYGWTWINPI